MKTIATIEIYHFVSENNNVTKVFDCVIKIERDGIVTANEMLGEVKRFIKTPRGCYKNTSIDYRNE